MVVGLAKVQENSICPIDVLMGLNESMEAAEICKWRLVGDMFVGALVTLVTDAALAEMIEAWAMIVGREDRELAGSVSLRVVG